jgi:hypothetical protein
MPTPGPGAACEHYHALKNRMRRESPDDLADYEAGVESWQGWHYTTITKENWIRLFFRVVWSSGFSYAIVGQKEEAYLEVLYRTVYPGGVHDPTTTDQFIEDVAAVLGNRNKNLAIVEMIMWLEEMGWERFKADYITPGDGLEERLDELRGIGEKTVKLLMSQTGIVDTAKADIWVTRFAELHGFADPYECVRLVAERCGDKQVLVDAVLFWAGRKHQLKAA